MINREIIYERNMTGSYMKIPSPVNGGFDEKMILKKKIPGILPVEKCFVDGQGMYWYNISGKQSLDTYCRMKSVSAEFVEKIVLSICSQIEILEWNLIKVDRLMLDPELIYVANSTEEIIFSIYPEGNHVLAREFQSLMEYLITKVDHSNVEAVKVIYGIYEKSLSEAYSIMDIRDEIINKRQEKLQLETVEKKKVEEKTVKTKESKESKEKIIERLIKHIKDELCSWLGIDELKIKPKKQTVQKKDEKRVKYEVSIDEAKEVVVPQMEIHPTVCLSEMPTFLEGRLRYEGNDGLTDIVLERKEQFVGQASDNDFQIKKETISRQHAKISYIEDAYYIEDLNSTNGTFVNDEALSYKEKRRLMPQDSVKIADVFYRFI